MRLSPTAVKVMDLGVSGGATPRVVFAAGEEESPTDSAKK
jgi:hypothetical protein